MVSWFSPVAHLLNLDCFNYQTLALLCITKKKYLIKRLRNELEKLFVDRSMGERKTKHLY